MNIARLSSAVLLLVSATGGAQAQSYPPDTVLVGTTAPVVAATSFGGSCYIGRGVSTFLRNNTAPTALISLQEIVDSKVWDLSGEAILNFSSATGGDIVFTNTNGYPADVRNPFFSSYTQSYRERQLVVKFVITFPDCSLDFLGAYVN